ncbi:L,D-transpeptidase [Mesorhizobium sp. INR15]|uniref:L,D-transpeptidase n=1 Tax=Mesorhizobium sp. INR15 TaxID=2654248 RepID=UPI0018968AAD|nr:L,D-transpeptidase [Mesorhizobium sp. INR15]QPC92267.1 L,D-transpeptidase family protein [Mesorhizobium sp. INR15]
MSDSPIFFERLSRRAFLGASALGAASVALSACTTTEVVTPPPVAAAPPGPALGDTATMYTARTDEGFQLPAIPVAKLDPKFVRQIVADPTGEKPGTIVVDVSEHFLYLVRDGGKAIRYGVSLGKAGFGWTGTAVVQARKKWPVWTPPPEMIQRRPELAKFKDGMPPGPQSPLGARALYLFRDGKDTMYRLHGTPEWDSIGKNASSGCVRFMNQDIIDLYSRVNGPAQVFVRANLSPAAKITAVSNRMAEPIDAGVPKDAEMLK